MILLTLLHIFACIFLIFVVLIQTSKGSELGAAFGGSSQTIFGTRGAATFLSRLTVIVAVIFILTSLTLSIIASKGSSVVKKSISPPSETLPKDIKPQNIPPAPIEKK